MDKSSIIIRNSYNSLIRTLSKDTSKEDRKIIKKAFDLANSAHKKIKRKSGEPYIIHPISVAKIVSKVILKISAIKNGITPSSKIGLSQPMITPNHITPKK